MRPYPQTLAGVLAAILLASTAATQVDPRGRSVLFIRGADGSGGLGSGSTEHLSDINNTSTTPGNHGFGELATALRGDGFAVSQWIESSGTLTLALLQPHRVVVFGSNNRTYSQAEVDAFHAYFDAGGSALFMSDANWGPDWSAAPRSDNQFLARYGITTYQDSGQGVATLQRTTPGRYVQPDHPIVSGPDGAGAPNDIAAYEGEGVSFASLGRGTGSLVPAPLVSATGFNVRQLTANGSPGGLTPAGPNDVALAVVQADDSSLVTHFDRNTFFNANGTGTNLTRRDNRAFALNLFRFLASVPGSFRPVGTPCSAGHAPRLTVGAALLGRAQRWTVRGAAPNAPAALLLAPGPQQPTPLPVGCVLHTSLVGLLALPGSATDAQGTWNLTLSLPGDLALSGAQLTGQGVQAVVGGRALGVADLSDAIEVTLGFAR